MVVKDEFISIVPRSILNWILEYFWKTWIIILIIFSWFIGITGPSAPMVIEPVGSVIPLANNLGRTCVGNRHSKSKKRGFWGRLLVIATPGSMDLIILKHLPIIKISRIMSAGKIWNNTSVEHRREYCGQIKYYGLRQLELKLKIKIFSFFIY